MSSANVENNYGRVEEKIRNERKSGYEEICHVCVK